MIEVLWGSKKAERALIDIFTRMVRDVRGIAAVHEQRGSSYEKGQEYESSGFEGDQTLFESGGKGK